MEEKKSSHGEDRAVGLKRTNISTKGSRRAKEETLTGKRKEYEPDSEMRERGRSRGQKTHPPGASHTERARGPRSKREEWFDLLRSGRERF